MSEERLCDFDVFCENTIQNKCFTNNSKNNLIVSSKHLPEGVRGLPCKNLNKEFTGIKCRAYR